MPATLEEAFSAGEIINVLCNLRIAAARKRKRQHLLYNIAKDSKNQPKAIQDLGERCGDVKKLYSMLPPRRLWKQHRIRNRRNKNQVEVDKIALRSTVERWRKDPSSQGGDNKWLINLDNFVGEVQKRVLGEEPYCMETPEIVPIKKNPNKKQDNTYRPISKYTDLVDQVVDKICAKYFREILDPSFLDCSYAFRTKNKKNCCPNQHDAIEKLLHFREAHSEVTLWVAECDIQKFFDCVNHEEALKAFDRAFDRIQKKADQRAVEILKAYLNSYSFLKVARPKSKEYFDKKEIKGKIEWCEELEACDDLLSQQNVGIPQGGAMSCLIVNLILDEADRRVVEDFKDRDLLYLRYCDDIIVIHTAQEKCKDALDRYLAALKSLKLFPHEPREVDKFDKNFWKGKSKLPYEWLYEPARSNTVPWLAFVGYHIRHDGLLRIRPESIGKELTKQVKEVDEIFKVVCPKLPKSNSTTNIRRSELQIQHSLHQKLISMSVGRIKFSVEHDFIQSFCWCSGFKVLKNHQPVLLSQLKHLDRGREEQLHRAKRKLRKLGLPVSSKPSKHKILRYYGSPFSYYAQFFPRSP